jgi:centromere/kinetochore protein ZW10
VQYRADFPIDLQKQVVFVDLAPIFSHMADVVLRRQIQLAIDTISEVSRSLYIFSTHIITSSC